MNAIGIVGRNFSDKVDFIERVISELESRDISVSVIICSLQEIPSNETGIESRLFNAGAEEVQQAPKDYQESKQEYGDDARLALQKLLSKIKPVDLVLIEGYLGGGCSISEIENETGSLAISNDRDECIRIDLKDIGAIADELMATVGIPLLMRQENQSDMVENDCFALPAGINWTPVDTALNILREQAKTCVGTENILVEQAQSRVLANDAIAKRSNPPAANSAVDGYGFMHLDSSPSETILTLAKGKALAGYPFSGPLKKGQAVRIMTGALLPEGVDTVVMQEDVTLKNGQIIFNGQISIGLNTRSAAEDIKIGDTALTAAHVLRAPDLAFLTASGISKVTVFQKLRIGILSTGDEIVPVRGGMVGTNTIDANRPMLLSLVDRFGHQAVDLGHVGDNKSEIRDLLDKADEHVDLIVTSGGVSGGDTDFMSTMLLEEGDLHTWRIAVKPGRPLAFGKWKDTPVFGLPGNPVAAFICTLIFVRPTLSQMSGEKWPSPQGFNVSADFQKMKKPGRREYLRARINGSGRVEIFTSEGSGRISGLSWADGLVELKEETLQISTGDSVRYYPYSSFGI